MISAEAEKALVEAAAERGVTVEEWLADAWEALGKFGVIAGRAVISREAGSGPLTRMVNEALERGRGPEAVRARLCRAAGIGASEVDGLTLAGVVTHICERKLGKRTVARVQETGGRL